MRVLDTQLKAPEREGVVDPTVEVTSGVEPQVHAEGDGWERNTARLSVPSTAPRQDLDKVHKDLRDDLTGGAFDIDGFSPTPWVVTRAEVQRAHRTLMGLSAEDFTTVLRAMDPGHLDNYIAGLEEHDGFDITRTEPTSLVAFAHRVAQDMPAGSADFVMDLHGPAKQSLATAFMQLPTADTKQSFAGALGAKVFEDLIRGDSAYSGIGAPMWQEGIFPDTRSTPRFQELYAAAETGDLPMPRATNDYNYAFVKGLFGNQGPGYFQSNRDALQDPWGAHTEMLDINTGARSEVNADAIYAQVKQLFAEGGKKIILFGHSKGGPDTREAFRRHPEMAEMVAGVVLVQPATSSQVATSILAGDRTLKPVADKVLEMVGGEIGAVESLGYDPKRVEKLRTEPYPGDEVPTVVVATSYNELGSGVQSITNILSREFHTDSDGLVPLAEQASGLQGAHTVVLPGMADHLMPIWDVGSAVGAVSGLLRIGDITGFEVQAEELAKHLEGISALAPLVGVWRRMVSRVAKEARAHVDAWPAYAERWTRALTGIGRSIDAGLKRLRSSVGKPPLDPKAMTQAAVALLHEKLAAMPPANT